MLIIVTNKRLNYSKSNLNEPYDTFCYYNAKSSQIKDVNNLHEELNFLI